MTNYPNSEILVETQWLADHLDDPALRIVDCHVNLSHKPGGGYAITKGLDAWREAHIPGADFIDIVDELSADHPTLAFMMPEPGQFARVMGAHGISDDNEVVLYSSGVNYWATRLFFMFQAMGHTKVRVLNGGWDKWQLEQRAVSSDQPKRQATQFQPRPQQGLFLGKVDIHASLADQQSCLLNALSPEVFSGESAAYGRPGHIPGSKNLPASDLIDPVTRAFLPATVLREKLDAIGALSAERVISYCGGGISATTSAFALWLLGYKNVAIYDGSMSEWAADPAMPLDSSF